MDDNQKIDEAIAYAKWMLDNLDPDDMYNFTDVRGKILSLIGYLTLLKKQHNNPTVTQPA